MNFEKYATLYQDNLLNDVIPFWLRNAKDREYGGYLTCLDQKGKVFDTDKFIWLQCRQVWTFAMLYTRVNRKEEWLDYALQGAEFLRKYGRDDEGDWYFSLTQDGRPIVQPYNIFSDCFAAMAFGQLFRATGDELFSQIATETFYKILKRQDNPKGKYSKAFPGTRPLQSFALPMILSNLVLELEHILDPSLVTETIQHGIHSVMEVFYDPGSGLLLENVTPDGSFSNTFEGRLINPGHGLEALWFIMDLAARNSDHVLMQKAVSVSVNLLEFGWDQQYEGIFYFKDIKGFPTQQLEWDQKLWWVHLEAITNTLKGYLYTGDERCLEWFEKLHAYTWAHFPDKEYGEWFGYLNRRGEVLLPLKGGKWKGCFHVPRSLYQSWKILDQLGKNQA